MLQHTTTEQASLRALGLAQEFVRVVRDRRAVDADLSWFEVVQAFAVARRELAPEYGSGATRGRVLALVLVSAAMISVFAFLTLAQ